MFNWERYSKDSLACSYILSLISSSRFINFLANCCLQYSEATVTAVTWPCQELTLPFNFSHNCMIGRSSMYRTEHAWFYSILRLEMDLNTKTSKNSVNWQAIHIIFLYKLNQLSLEIQIIIFKNLYFCNQFGEFVSAKIDIECA